MNEQSQIALVVGLIGLAGVIIGAIITVIIPILVEYFRNKNRIKALRRNELLKKVDGVLSILPWDSHVVSLIEISVNDLKFENAEDWIFKKGKYCYVKRTNNIDKSGHYYADFCIDVIGEIHSDEKKRERSRDVMIDSIEKYFDDLFKIIQTLFEFLTFMENHPKSLKKFAQYKREIENNMGFLFPPALSPELMKTIFIDAIIEKSEEDISDIKTFIKSNILIKVILNSIRKELVKNN